MKEFLIYADESDQDGEHYANFYGGLLVRSEHIDRVRQTLEDAKSTQGFGGEIKWQKVTENYWEKYKAVIDVFFDLVAQDWIKVRVMFTQKRWVVRGLTQYHREHGYHLLYFQFIKHAFGLAHCDEEGPVYLRIFVDTLPDNKEKNAQFKEYLLGIQNAPEFRPRQIKIRASDIAEVVSHDHVLMQFLDLVLGAMSFRLNQKHLIKPVGANRRGKRTIAKEKLYAHINRRIREIYPHFNIGISTGIGSGIEDRWRHPYRHWLFIPKDSELANK